MKTAFRIVFLIFVSYLVKVRGRPEANVSAFLIGESQHTFPDNDDIRSELATMNLEGQRPGYNKLDVPTHSFNEPSFRKLYGVGSADDELAETEASLMTQSENSTLPAKVAALVAMPLAQGITTQSAAEILDESILKGMIINPKARLYTGEYSSGGYEDYNCKTATYDMGCHNLRLLAGRVTSVDTFGKCVRLFLAYNCEGKSEAVYPGSGTSYNVLNSKLTKVASVGPCLPDEFQYASIISFMSFLDGPQNFVIKNTWDIKSHVPDLVEFLSHDKYSQSSANENSMVHYSLNGPHNRSEFLLAHISWEHVNMTQSRMARPRKTERPSGILEHAKHLEQSEGVVATRIELAPINTTWRSVNMENAPFDRSLNKYTGDRLGFGIPVDLGGPINEKHFFPISSAANKKWREITSGIRMYLEEHKGSKCVDLGLNFMFESSTTTRPYAFYYWIRFSTTKILYGQIQT